MNLARRLWQHGRDMVPIPGLHFDRPIVLLQSDDWGRAGLCDRAALEQLRSAGLVLGERPYDFYTLETAEDLDALAATLKRHRDSTGRHPCIQMNFIVSNLDFGKMRAESFSGIHLMKLSDGLPAGWNRPGLLPAYHKGIAEGVFQPALHGDTHFCVRAVERNLSNNTERANLLRTFWQAGTSYIHWRMPWIGYEYWDPEREGEERMLSLEEQRDLISPAVGSFAKLFAALPRSACAPGYRSNFETHRLWAQHGIRVAQNGPGARVPPYYDQFDMLHLSRNVEFEPATDTAFSVSMSVAHAEAAFARGIPAIVSLHAINFHSTVHDYRSRTLRMLDEFLSRIESKFPGALYVHDDDLYGLVRHGFFVGPQGKVSVKVTRKYFSKPGLRKRAGR